MSWFHVFGQIASDQNGSLGYGFVHFETEEAARNSIEKVNGMLLNGKKVFVGHFMSRKERLEMLGDKAKKFTNVYVKNLSETVDDKRLKELFEKYGKIISAKVRTCCPWGSQIVGLNLTCLVFQMMNGEDGERKGFGFVSFEDHEAAAKVSCGFRFGRK